VMTQKCLKIVWKKGKPESPLCIPLSGWGHTYLDRRYCLLLVSVLSLFRLFCIFFIFLLLTFYIIRPGIKIAIFI
jgi:hypothetical protein